MQINLSLNNEGYVLMFKTLLSEKHGEEIGVSNIVNFVEGVMFVNTSEEFPFTDKENEEWDGFMITTQDKFEILLTSPKLGDFLLGTYPKTFKRLAK